MEMKTAVNVKATTCATLGGSKTTVATRTVIAFHLMLKFFFFFFFKLTSYTLWTHQQESKENDTLIII